ncbi:MAG: NADH-quinone oxidoreductase subunit NuoF, partial [Thermoleophilia bacterium]|nr:NADH-quinone oxidoreductase subunit NuoF [Thermoleophilia bacterium]
MTTAQRNLIKPEPQRPRLTVPDVDIRICLGTGGVAAGSREVLQAFEEEVERTGVLALIRPREDTCSGRSAAVTGTGCQGLCAMDPLVEIHLRRKGSKSKVTYGQVTPAMVPEIVSKHILGGEPIEKWLVLTDEGPTEYNAFFDGQEKLTLRHVGIIDPEDIDDYLEAGGYQALYKVLSTMTPAEVRDEIKRSGLRGRGGAGFPTGQKWEFAAGYSSPDGVKYFICNGDEGDPGAFMDCSALEGEPHAVFEGMAIGAYAIGASVGYMYVRAEYPLALRRIKIGLKAAEERGLIGDNIMGSDFSFHIRLKEGAGAFVCGEETALMQSIEGERGMPRLRPPFPAESGLWERPSNINNVETLAVVPWIIENGADAFAARGYERSKGTKVFALAGKVNRTGLAEVPMGMTLREVIFGIGGGVKNNKKFKAVQMGGPSGGCLPESMLDLPVDYETINQTGAIVGSGGMIVIDEDNCIVDTARYFLSFTQQESCGKCPPCRIGTKRMLDVLNKICDGKGTLADIDFLEEIAAQVKVGSLCALGGTAPNPVLTALKYFRDEFEEHVVDRKCRAGICTALVHYSIDAEACTGCRACVRVCPTGAITGERKEP